MESKGLKALKEIKKGGREDDDFGWLSNSYLYEEEIATIEKKLKALKVIIKTLGIRVSMNKMGQCLLEDNHCIYAIPRSTYDLLKEVLNGQ